MPQNASAYPTDSTLPTQPAAQGITRHLLVVMGVCGSGKSTVAEGLHNELGWPWLDADSLHAPSNIGKMAHGIPLTDEDRQGWLTRCHAWLAEKQKAGTGGILACSALRRIYRDQLRQDGVKPLFIYLSADTSVLAQRLKRGPTILCQPPSCPARYKHWSHHRQMNRRSLFPCCLNLPR